GAYWVSEPQSPKEWIECTDEDAALVNAAPLCGGGKKGQRGKGKGRGRAHRFTPSGARTGHAGDAACIENGTGDDAMQPRFSSRQVAFMLVGLLAVACARDPRSPEAERKANARPLAAEPAATAPLTDRDGKVLSDVAARALPAVVSVASTRVAKL